MSRLLLVSAIALLASCKTVDVAVSWSPVTHKVNGDRLNCVSYQVSNGTAIVPTEETDIIWALNPGDYPISVQAIDCDTGLESGFTDPVEVKVKAEG